MVKNHYWRALASYVFFFVTPFPIINPTDTSVKYENIYHSDLNMHINFKFGFLTSGTIFITSTYHENKKPIIIELKKSPRKRIKGIRGFLPMSPFSYHVFPSNQTHSRGQ